MPEDIVDKLQLYNDKYRYYNEEHLSYIDSTMRNNYESVRQKYHDSYKELTKEDLQPIPNPIIGYQGLSLQYYQLTDFYYYLSDSMMPNVSTEGGVNAESEANKINLEDMSHVSLSTFSKYTSQGSAENAVRNYAKALVKSGYVTVTIDEDFARTWTVYNDYGVWYGRLKVQNNSDTDDIAYTIPRTVRVDASFENFMSQKILKQFADIDPKDKGNMYDVLAYKDNEKYANDIKLYGASRLESFYNANEGAMSVLAEAGQGEEDSELYDIYQRYYERLQATQIELDLRNNELNAVSDLLEDIVEKRIGIQTLLNMEGTISLLNHF